MIVTNVRQWSLNEGHQWMFVEFISLKMFTPVLDLGGAAVYILSVVAVTVRDLTSVQT